MTVWHTLSSDEVVARLGVDAASGLLDAEAARRLGTYGSNVIAEPRRRSVVRMLLGQFTDFMVLVLLAAAVVAGPVGELQDAAAIAAIVGLNGLLGFVQEYRAERAVLALKALAAPHARVRRAGVVHTLPSAGLVPGDVVVLAAGDAVPADLRLVECVQLRTDEAALSGESQPVDKISTLVARDDLPLGDRRNMAFKGTLVTYGRGLGVVVATGMATELGRIAALLAGEGGATPLQKRLTHLGTQLALAVIALCGVILTRHRLLGSVSSYVVSRARVSVSVVR